MGTLTGEMKQALVNNKRAQAQVVVRRGQRIIVIGAMPTNLPPELRDHPFIEVWQGDNGLKRRSIPESAGMILHTRFVAHADLDRFRQQAHRRGIDFYPQPFTTGDLHEILAPLAPTPVEPVEDVTVGAVEPVVAAPTHEATEVASLLSILTEDEGAPVITAKNKTVRGALKRFIATRANFEAPSDVAEANRLYPYAQQQADLKGVTRASIVTAFRVARKALGLPPRRVFRGRHASARTRAVPAPGSVVARASHQHASHADVIKLFDEAAAHMQNGVAAVQLAKERYVQLVEAHKSTDDVKARLKAMLDTL